MLSANVKYSRREITEIAYPERRIIKNMCT